MTELLSILLERMQLLKDVFSLYVIPYKLNKTYMLLLDAFLPKQILAHNTDLSIAAHLT